MRGHRICRVAAALAVMCILLAGCSQEPQILESEHWTQMPQLTYGVFEYEKLTALPWHAGRAEAVSHNQVAETADGYYCTYSARLYYSDKDAPDLWVPVCNEPDCDHVSHITCNACAIIGTFVIRNNRIYFEELAGRNLHLYNKNESDIILVSTRLDGSDKQLAYAIEDESLNSDSAGGFSTLLTPTMWLYTDARINTDGSTTVRVHKVDENGQQLILNKESNTDRVSGGWWGGLYGDKYYLISAMSTESLLRFEDDRTLELDMSSIPENGGYVSGDVIRHFVQNEGYFDRNLATGEEVKLAPAQIENSNALVVLPNCIVESTLFNEESQELQAGHSMKIFDGDEWHTVGLPKELEQAQDVTLVLKSITSDSIFFTHTQKVTIVVDEEEYHYTDLVLYRIAIGKETWDLEYYGTIQQPREHIEE